jgi:hypothetical protein
MDPTALYYALSTIAQCAAALAALIGFLGMWRLDRLRDEEKQLDLQLRELMSRTTRLTGQTQRPSDDRPDLNRVPQWQLDRAIEAVITDPRAGVEQQIKPELEATRQRGRHLPDEQQQLISALQRFLRRTLIILAFAIIGLAFADAINAWVGTALIARLLIVLAGCCLGRDTYTVVREAARFLHTRQVEVRCR